jgi:hypothetical protein
MLADRRGGIMRCIQEFCAKINEEECVLLSEAFDGSWSFLIWGKHPVHGYLGRTSRADAKEKALVAARKYLATSGRARESGALLDLRWKVAIQTIINRSVGHNEMHSNGSQRDARQ